jgi:hypothetical protein
MVATMRSALPARPASAAPASSTIAAAATAAATATEVAAANRLRPRLVDDQRPAIKLVLMEFVDRLLRVFVGRHFDKRKPARPAGGLVAHHAHVVDSSGAAEEFCQFFVRALIREVANVQSAAHRCETLSRASDRNGELSARERPNTG